MTFGVIIPAVGLLMLVVGSRLRSAQRGFMRRAERTQGEIVSLRRKLSSSTVAGPGAGSDTVGAPTMTRSSPVFYPTVAFTAASGERVTAEAPVGTNPPPGRVGDTVPVLYDPADPTEIRIDTTLGRGNLPAALAVWLGAILAAIGIVVLLVAG